MGSLTLQPLSNACRVMRALIFSAFATPSPLPSPKNGGDPQGVTVMCDRCVECSQCCEWESLNTFSVPPPAWSWDAALRGQSRREGESRAWDETGGAGSVWDQAAPGLSEAARSGCAKALGLEGQQGQWGWMCGVTWSGRDWGAVGPISELRTSHWDYVLTSVGVQ